ncbi:MAG TPA: GDCCVxC domain-containing (seleno)protein [Gaiellaceae bacterium]|nr:GDCCVxC domain-containing (seleno)protein [Gaiellaceae bacterium]
MAGAPTEARITCPRCGFSRVEAMPVDACVRFYRCGGCGALLSPRPGDCCVFCSYADSVCPPRRAAAP